MVELAIGLVAVTIVATLSYREGFQKGRMSAYKHAIELQEEN